MYIQKIHIENFRLLKNVDIVLDKSLTLIVGKNNTGKTSVAICFNQSLTKRRIYRLTTILLNVGNSFMRHLKNTGQVNLKILR